MAHPSRSRALCLSGVALVIVGGVAGCGASGKSPAGPPATSSSTPTVVATPPIDTIPGLNPTVVPGAGLATDFPQQAVPLVAGTTKTLLSGAGQGANARKGWVLQINVPETTQQCFTSAAVKLVGAGFIKRGQLTAGNTVQAQYTNDRYRVIISTQSDGAGGCILGYEVGEK